VLPPAEFELLARLTEAQRSKALNLEELAAHLGMSPSVLQRRLKALVDEGWVERRQESSPRGRIVRYLPRARVSIQWVSPLQDVAIAWSTPGEMVWEFPLISQVPDAPARSCLQQFFGRLSMKGILRGAPWFEGDVMFHHDARHSLAAIVYGSAARGNATDSSDVDLLLITDTDAHHEALHDIAADVSLEAPRDLQLKVLSLHRTRTGEPRFPRIPPPIEQAVRRDGLIVHDGLHWPSLWEMVYGDRTVRRG